MTKRKKTDKKTTGKPAVVFFFNIVRIIKKKLLVLFLCGAFVRVFNLIVFGHRSLRIVGKSDRRY
ncbi:MAG: hypothetical protein SO186_04590, partial [Lachnospiraceae bacterium]|nr:hypothetical protein [Lachnospiraceae bacterium]